MITGDDILTLMTSKRKHSESPEDIADLMQNLGVDYDSMVIRMKSLTDDLVGGIRACGDEGTPEEAGLLGLVSGFEIGFRLALKEHGIKL